jgi:hypothetical protein
VFSYLLYGVARRKALPFGPRGEVGS